MPWLRSTSLKSPGLLSLAGALERRGLEATPIDAECQKAALAAALSANKSKTLDSNFWVLRYALRLEFKAGIG